MYGFKQIEPMSGEKQFTLTVDAAQLARGPVSFFLSFRVPKNLKNTILLNALRQL